MVFKQLEIINLAYSVYAKTMTLLTYITYMYVLYECV